MRKRIINLLKFYVPVLMLLIIASSCSKDDDNNPVNQQEEPSEEIVAVVGSSMGESTGGLSAQVKMAGDIAGSVEGAANKLSLFYNVTKDTTVQLSDTLSILNKTYIYDYIFTLSFPEQVSNNALDFAFTSTGSFDAPNMNSTSNASANWSIGNIISMSPFTLNGSYSRTGVQNTSYLVPHVITSSLDITYSDLEFSRMEHEILGGSAEFTITGTFDTLEFSYTGTLVFNGDGTATVTIGNYTYTIDLQSGAVL